MNPSRLTASVQEMELYLFFSKVLWESYQMDGEDPTGHNQTFHETSPTPITPPTHNSVKLHTQLSCDIDSATNSLPTPSIMQVFLV